MGYLFRFLTDVFILILLLLLLLQIKIEKVYLSLKLLLFNVLPAGSVTTPADDDVVAVMTSLYSLQVSRILYLTCTTVT